MSELQKAAEAAKKAQEVERRVAEKKARAERAENLTKFNKEAAAAVAKRLGIEFTPEDLGEARGESEIEPAWEFEVEQHSFHLQRRVGSDDSIRFNLHHIKKAGFGGGNDKEVRTLIHNPADMARVLGL